MKSFKGKFKSSTDVTWGFHNWPNTDGQPSALALEEFLQSANTNELVLCALWENCSMLESQFSCNQARKKGKKLSGLERKK